jgi:hypothetical protein
LNEEEKKLDPTHQGVLLDHINKQPTDSFLKITLRLNNASLRQVLGEIQRQFDFVYDVGDSRIGVWHDSGEGMTRATFVVPVYFFHAESTEAGQPSYDVAPQLLAKGVHFSPGMSAVYLPRQRKLIVVQNQDAVEAIDYLFYRARTAQASNGR